MVSILYGRYTVYLRLFDMERAQLPTHLNKPVTQPRLISAVAVLSQLLLWNIRSQSLLELKVRIKLGLQQILQPEVITLRHATGGKQL